MQINKIDENNLVKYRCCICDEYAAYEISNNGGLQLYWAHGPEEKEITLCKNCFDKLKNLMNDVK